MLGNDYMNNRARRHETELWRSEEEEYLRRSVVSSCEHTGEGNWLHWHSWSWMATAIKSSEVTVLGAEAKDVE